jgi:hypothetical protein
LAQLRVEAVAAQAKAPLSAARKAMRRSVPTKTASTVARAPDDSRPPSG